MRVEFWNEARDELITTREMSEAEVDALLESDEDIELEGATYSYSRRAAAGPEGVKVWLYQTMYVSPQDVVFTLPTISDGLPEETEPPRGPDLLVITEDSWRQLEVVSSQVEAAVEACLAEIRGVIVEDLDSPGYSRMHLRSEVPRPLGGVEIALPELIDRVLGDGKVYDGVAFESADGAIANAFALRTPPGLTLYGLTEGEVVQVLAMVEPPTAWEDPFFRLLRDLDLRMVDWVAAQTLLPPG